MHNKAWGLVSDYMKKNLETFSGKSIEAESTVLPSITEWIQDTLSDLPVARLLLYTCKCFGSGVSMFFFFASTVNHEFPDNRVPYTYKAIYLL